MGSVEARRDVNLSTPNVCVDALIAHYLGIYSKQPSKSPQISGLRLFKTFQPSESIQPPLMRCSFCTTLVWLALPFSELAFHVSISFS
jgi:hypothetical protein